jgi:hypothetical protein
MDFKFNVGLLIFCLELLAPIFCPVRQHYFSVLFFSFKCSKWFLCLAVLQRAEKLVVLCGFIGL